MRKLLFIFIVLNGCNKDLSFTSNSKKTAATSNRIFIEEKGISKHREADRYIGMNNIVTGFEQNSENQIVQLYKLNGKEETLIIQHNKEVAISEPGSYRVDYIKNEEEETKYFIISPTKV